ncbi:hypothetical protein [Fischerella sp. PCC 9605]|uniref:hypothetical protein n=1 Tax=Fischerella sp. PCC 9605 TaxID=1173024 RepID=UPI00047D4D95|nr:hypothetical protein [Fischerella sp. PCC 9605]
MHQYLYHLLVLILAANSAAIAIPSQAQTQRKSNPENINNITIPIVSQSSSATNTAVTSNLGDVGSSSNSQPAVISESADSASTTSTEPAATNPNPRIPISSRIFAVPSMQQ